MKGSYSIYDGVNVNGMSRSQVEMPGCIVWNTIRNIIRLLIYYNQWSDNGVIYQ